MVSFLFGLLFEINITLCYYEKFSVNVEVFTYHIILKKPMRNKFGMLKITSSGICWNSVCCFDCMTVLFASHYYLIKLNIHWIYSSINSEEHSTSLKFVVLDIFQSSTLCQMIFRCYILKNSNGYSNLYVFSCAIFLFFFIPFVCVCVCVCVCVYTYIHTYVKCLPHYRWG